MMIVPNSLVGQKQGVQGEEEEEVVDQRNGGQTGTPTSCADDLTGLSQSGVSVRMRGTGENEDDGMGFQITKRAEGARD